MRWLTTAGTLEQMKLVMVESAFLIKLGGLQRLFSLFLHSVTSRILTLQLLIGVNVFTRT